jgi:hypothetical protein
MLRRPPGTQGHTTLFRVAQEGVDRRLRVGVDVSTVRSVRDY